MKANKDNGTKLLIEVVHPMVGGAENFSYHIWPADQINISFEKFGTLGRELRCWRLVKRIPGKVGVMDTPKCSVEDRVIALAQESKLREALQEKAAVKKKALKEEAALKEKQAFNEKQALKKKVVLKKKPLEEKKALRRSDGRKFLKIVGWRLL